MHRIPLPLIAAVALLSCSPEPSGVVDPLRAPPVLVSVVPDGATVNTDTINVGSTRLPTDRLEIQIVVAAVVQSPPGSAPVGSVSAWVVDDRGVMVNGPFALNDAGNAPDTTAGDGTYAGIARLVITRVDVGAWSVRVAASGDNGTRSTVAVIPLNVVRNNQPPVLSDLVALSSISASDPSPLMQLRIRAADPDGASDVLRVYFNSYRPSGQAASGNPFLMFDDGNAVGTSGDTMPGDSVYSLRIQFGGAPAGTYRFEFRAIDRSSDSSNVIIHLVEVTP